MKTYFSLGQNRKFAHQLREKTTPAFDMQRSGRLLAMAPFGKTSFCINFGFFAPKEPAMDKKKTIFYFARIYII